MSSFFFLQSANSQAGSNATSSSSNTPWKDFTLQPIQSTKTEATEAGLNKPNQNIDLSYLSSLTTGSASSALYTGMPLSSLDNADPGYYNPVESVLAALEEDEDRDDIQQQQEQQQARNTNKVSGISNLNDIEQCLKDVHHPPPNAPPQPVLPAGGNNKDVDTNSVSSTVSSPNSSNSGNVYIPLPSTNHRYMSKSDCALVIKLQLSQLQLESADDFYNQVFTARRGGQIKPNSNVIPRLNNSRMNNPKHGNSAPTNTLGRIVSSNLRKPKKLMEFQSAENENPLTLIPDPDLAPPRRYMFSSRSISYLIEEGSRSLMDLEDCDSNLLATNMNLQYYPQDPTIQANMHRLQQQREICVQRLVESLDLSEMNLNHLLGPALSADAQQSDYSQHLLFKLANIDKGRVLIFRSLLLLTPPHNAILISLLLQDPQQLLDRKNENTENSIDDRLYTLISDIVYTLPFPIVNALFRLLISKLNLSLLGSRLGCELFQVFMKAAHDQQQHLNNDNNHNNPAVHGVIGELNAWRSFYTQLMLFLHHENTVENLLLSSSKGANTASRQSIYELFAAIFSHARPEERANMHEKMGKILENELIHIYGSALNAPVDGNPAPHLLPPLHNAIKFLCSLFVSTDEKSLFFRINGLIQQSELAMQQLLQQQEVKKNQPSFAQIAGGNNNNNNNLNTAHANPKRAPLSRAAAPVSSVQPVQKQTWAAVTKHEKK